MSAGRDFEVLNTCLWLSSPALPVGGFSWSQGLESAILSGKVHDYKSLYDYLLSMLDFSLKLWDLPLIVRFTALCQNADGEGFVSLDKKLKAGRSTKELYEEECAMGRALKSLLLSLKLFPSWLDERGTYGYVSMFALAGFMRIKAFDKASLLSLLYAYSYGWAQNQASVACKAIPLGQTDAQRVLKDLGAALEKAAREALLLEDEDLGSALPGAFILSAAHENQYSRLFRS